MNHDAVPLVHLRRGSLIESVHRGHIAVANAKGQVLHAAGNPHYATFARSAAKLLQAVPVVVSGAADRFGFAGSEIALICASHSGQDIHVQAVRRMLEKIGVDESFLQCGAHEPYHEPSAAALRLSGAKPQAVHNNCSGKHCGMLALASCIGASLVDYPDPEHPVQKMMLAAVASLAGVRPEDIRLGTDGCGVPVFGLPLAALAAAYARLGSPEPHTAEGKAYARIVRAVTAHPAMLAGEGRYDTRLILATQGRVIGKMGAEGVFAATLAGKGLALAVKIEDGSQRALYPAVTEALLQLGWINAEQALLLQDFHQPPLRNRKNDIVGATIPVLRLT